MRSNDILNVELKQETRSWLRIVACVVAVHLLLISYLAMTFRSSPVFSTIPKRLTAKTIQLTPKTLKETKIEKTLPVALSKKEEIRPAPVEVQSIKNNVSPKPVAKQTSSKSKKKVEKKIASPAPATLKAQEEVNMKQKELLANAQKSIGKIQSVPATISDTQQKELPSLFLDLLSDSAVEGEEVYQQELSQHLRLFLRLPEHGSVTIELSVGRNGKVIKLDVIHAQSTINKKYVEKTIPTLTFPDFGKQFLGEQQHTFTIVLRNDL